MDDDIESSLRAIDEQNKRQTLREEGKLDVNRESKSQESFLKAIDKSNVAFIPKIPNSYLEEYYTIRATY